MNIHWGKTQAISLGSSRPLQQPDGTPIEDANSLIYLGGQLDKDGRVESELSRRIGLACGEFRSLQKLWGHSGISRRDKLACFHAFVVSKLLYGLSTCWLCKAQRRRIDGFYARCLRRIMHIPAAYYSRVSNLTVFQRAQVPALTQQLERRQFLLLGVVARSEDGSTLRRDTFFDGSVRPKAAYSTRRVGRPRQTWTDQLLKRGSVHFNGAMHFE